MIPSIIITGRCANKISLAADINDSPVDNKAPATRIPERRTEKNPQAKAAAKLKSLCFPFISLPKS